MTTVSEPIISESEGAELEEPGEHTTEQTSTEQDTQEDKALPLQDTISDVHKNQNCKK
jgi:hypothetical protein